MERADICIIGTGPAGISAAITAAIRGKRILFFGNAELSKKVDTTHTIHNYPGLPDVTGAELKKAFQKHLSSMQISIREEKVTLVYPMGSYFSIQASGGNYEASTVILATGVTSDKTLPGEEKYLGRGVSYCATCDALFYRGKSVAVIGYSEDAYKEAVFLTGFASEVSFFPMTKTAAEEASRDAGAAASEKKGILRISGEKPLEILGQMVVSGIRTEENTLPFDGIFVLRDSVAPATLLPGLATDGPHISVDRSMATNVPGCFACGDIVGKPYQYIKAAGEGNVAALSAVAWLDNRK